MNTMKTTMIRLVNYHVAVMMKSRMCHPAVAGWSQQQAKLDLSHGRVNNANCKTSFSNRHHAILYSCQTHSNRPEKKSENEGLEFILHPCTVHTAHFTANVMRPVRSLPVRSRWSCTRQSPHHDYLLGEAGVCVICQVPTCTCSAWCLSAT